MNNHNSMVKDQLIHMLLGTLIFVVLGAIAVGLDLAAAKVKELGVSPFTSSAIEHTAHGMLILDLGTISSLLGPDELGLVQGDVRVKLSTYMRRMMRDSVRIYFAPLKGALKGMRIEMHRAEREAVRHRQGDTKAHEGAVHSG